MCTHERLKRDHEMFGVGVVEISEKTEAQRKRPREGSWSEKLKTEEGSTTLRVRLASSQRLKVTSEPSSESNWRSGEETESNWMEYYGFNVLIFTYKKKNHVEKTKKRWLYIGQVLFLKILNLNLKFEILKNLVESD